MHIYIPQGFALKSEPGRRSLIPGRLRKLTGRYFVACTVCGVKLPDNAGPIVGTSCGYPVSFPYFIVLESREGERFLDYAICLACELARRDEYSHESKKRVAALFAERVDFQSRFEQLKGTGEGSPYLGSGCLLTNTHVVQSRGWRTVFLCKDCHILYTTFPYSICEEGLALVDECLSPESRAVDNRFVEAHLQRRGDG